MEMIFHTSPHIIECIDDAKTRLFGKVLFFADEPYFMGSSESSVIYSLEVDEDQLIDESELVDESELIDEIAHYLDVPSDDAIDIIAGDDEAADYEEQWHIQRLKAEHAKKIGYRGCISRDEQGTCYMIEMDNDLLEKMSH